MRKKSHPTWQGGAAALRLMAFGGESKEKCSDCGRPIHHLLTLNPIPDGVNVTGLRKLSLSVCLSCLGWESEELFYQHDDEGRPHCFRDGPPGITPQFPAGPLRATKVRLADQGARWFLQSWGGSNGRQNLHRVGGPPCWIQSASYLKCPQCGRRMSFLLQLDSDLPKADGGEWLWGSGGIAYGCWCDDCRISGWLWQCT